MQAPEVVAPSRRAFLRNSSLMSGAVVTSATLAAFSAHSARASGNGNGNQPDWLFDGHHSQYGKLTAVADQDGQNILALPPGFQYRTFSKTGDTMSDGNTVPMSHDGMSCFDWRGSTVRLIRNHEVRASGAYALGGPVATRYDALGVGGTVTLEFDTRSKRFTRDFISLNGTIVNCSGGLAWRNFGWITSEETTEGTSRGWGKKHGYNFLVPLSANSPAAAVPLTWMGRFAHEGAVADVNGLLYETEDASNTSGFYRATPVNAGNLQEGGKLEMLAIKGQSSASLITGQVVGKRLPVEWVTIDSPDPDLEGGALSCYRQGLAKGGASFNRLEGVFIGQDGRSVYFVSTSGGDKKYGQLWHYIPASKLNDQDQLVLVFESPAGSVLDSPDNICITPKGGILFCEDDASSDNDGHELAPGIANVNRLIGMGGLGEPFEFAVNIFSDSEFAGACFSPDGEILFVNIQGGDTAGSGMTCAIWGPWERGPL